MGVLRPGVGGLIFELGSAALSGVSEGIKGDENFGFGFGCNNTRKCKAEKESISTERKKRKHKFFMYKNLMLLIQFKILFLPVINRFAGTIPKRQKTNFDNKFAPCKHE
jgi:hypothetical protein